MTRNFLEALESSTELDRIDKDAISDIYCTVFDDNTDCEQLVDQATDEPPSLAEFETLGEHKDDDISITEEGLKMTQTLPDGTDVTTVK